MSLNDAALSSSYGVPLQRLAHYGISDTIAINFCQRRVSSHHSRLAAVLMALKCANAHALTGY